MPRCDEDPSVWAVVLSGAGSAFCVGGDLKSFAEQGEELPRHLKKITTYLHAAISHLARMDPPVVAAVHGAAAGGGFSLAISCDLVVATESARFAMAYSKAGLTPDGSSSYHLPRLVGMRRAMELTLTGRELSAQEALEWGIITRVVPDKDLLEEAAGLAQQLATARRRPWEPPSGYCTAAEPRLWRRRWSTRREPQPTSRARPTPARASPPSRRSARRLSRAGEQARVPVDLA